MKEVSIRTLPVFGRRKAPDSRRNDRGRLPFADYFAALATRAAGLIEAELIFCVPPGSAIR